MSLRRCPRPETHCLLQQPGASQQPAVCGSNDSTQPNIRIRTRALSETSENEFHCRLPPLQAGNVEALRCFLRERQETGSQRPAPRLRNATQGAVREKQARCTPAPAVES